MDYEKIIKQGLDRGCKIQDLQYGTEEDLGCINQAIDVATILAATTRKGEEQLKMLEGYQRVAYEVIFSQR